MGCLSTKNNPTNPFPNSFASLFLPIITKFLTRNSNGSCENETLFCGGMNSNFDISDIADSWHSVCDSRITFTPTTPALSTYSSIDINACKSAWDGCMSQSAEVSKCRGYTTKEREFQSCLCQPQMLSAAFTCSYYANVSCEFAPGTLSKVNGYAYCSNFMAVVGPLVNATPTESGTFLSTLSASLTVSKPPFPGSSQTSTGPFATKTPSSVAAIAPEYRLLIGVFLGAIAGLSI
ncbi:hypothetical protein GQ44DRAFT_765065 [Phaeosphaeriaceae sp. PMI808]|nr:hypothetical protein GQ44DRAFT_765065 [Phaeosphaeriaceae sp. PMI808]